MILPADAAWQRRRSVIRSFIMIRQLAQNWGSERWVRQFYMFVQPKDVSWFRFHSQYFRHVQLWPMPYSFSKYYFSLTAKSYCCGLCAQQGLNQFPQFKYMLSLNCLPHLKSKAHHIKCNLTQLTCSVCHLHNSFIGKVQSLNLRNTIINRKTAAWRITVDIK